MIGNWNVLARKAREALRRKAPELLTGFGIAGMIGTTVLAVKATPEAMRRIAAKKEETGKEKLTAAETAQAAWKCYIPAAATGTVSTGMLISASVVNGRRRAALVATASIAENALEEYRDKVVETLGAKKDEAILSAIDRDQVDRNPPPAQMEEPPVTEGAAGQTLCYDALAGRYFHSDAETIRQAENRLNRRMATLSEPYISLNEFYEELDLPPVDIGYDLGWNVNDGMIELRFSSQLLHERTPCLVVSHLKPPKYGYNMIG